MNMLTDASTPMTYETYEKRIDELLRAPFPWVGNAFLDPAPGHLKVVASLLADFERLIGRSHLAAHLKFLFIARDQDEDLSVRIDCASLSDAQREALKLIATRAQVRALKRCVVCGEPTPGRGLRQCEAHDDWDVSRAFEEASPSSKETAGSLGSGKSQCSLARMPADDKDGASEATDLGVDEPRLSLATLPPIVELFTQESVMALKDSMAGQESDARNRIKTMCERLTKTGSNRPLAVLPEDWKVRIETLAETFPNFAAYFEFLIGHCALSAMGDGRLSHPPVLFNGPPGIGKTELVSSLSALFDTDCLQLDMAVAQTSSPLTGSETHWGNSRQGRFFDTLVFGRTANPIVMIDEIDKVSGHNGYDPVSGLLMLLEPRTAASFTDLSVPQVPLDASHVVWFAVSNDVSRISTPLLSRFERFDIPTPDRAQTIHSACGIYRRIVQNRSWGRQFEPELDANVAGALAEMPPRQIRLMLETAFGRAALAGRYRLTGDDLVSAEARDGRTGHTIGFVRFSR